MKLIKFLFRKNESEINKGYICFTLGRIGDKRVIPYINKAIDEAVKEWNQKEQSTLIGMGLRALMKIGDKNSVFLVLRIIRNDEILRSVSPLPYMVLQEKGYLARDSVIKTMIDLFKRKDFWMIEDRGFAITVFRKLGSEESIMMIQEFLKKEKDLNEIEKKRLEKIIRYLKGIEKEEEK